MLPTSPASCPGQEPHPQFLPFPPQHLSQVLLAPSPECIQNAKPLSTFSTAITLARGTVLSPGPLHQSPCFPHWLPLECFPYVTHGDLLTWYLRLYHSFAYIHHPTGLLTPSKLRIKSKLFLLSWTTGPVGCAPILFLLPYFIPWSSSPLQAYDWPDWPFFLFPEYTKLTLNLILPDFCLAGSFSSCRSQLKCHFLQEAVPDPQSKLPHPSPLN